jgi:two-component system, NarL family, response regulator LiaR
MSQSRRQAIVNQGATMSTQPRIRVLLVDDHAMVRRGLAAFLKAYPDLELCGEVESGEEAVRLCAEFSPDVVLMDLMLGELDGATATRLIRQDCPEIQVIALTSFREDTLVQRALQAGAISYLLKNVSADDLAAAIRAAHAGQSTLAPEAIAALLNAAASDSPALGHDLTAREHDVLALMVKGLSNTEIAGRLIVSQSTIKTHVSSILAKLGASSRTEAVALAVQHNIV